MELALGTILAIIVLAFLCEYMDSTLGMGYGTTLTPVLLILGFSAGQIVPAVLLSELVTGLSAGLMHHRVGNVNLSLGSRANKIMWAIAAPSILGATAESSLLIKIVPFETLSPILTAGAEITAPRNASWWSSR